MNYAGNTEIIRKHFHDHQENVCIAVLSIIPLCRTFYFSQRLFFIQGAFKNIQGPLWKIQGLFKDIPQLLNFQRLFKDMTFFQGLFKACANHVNLSDRNQKVRCEWKLKIQMQSNPQLNL